MVLIPYRKGDWLADSLRLFDFSIGGDDFAKSSLFGSQWAPAIDIYDSKDTIKVKAEMPGLAKDEIEVSIDGDSLMIKGEKKKDNESKDDDYIRTERFYGSFCRTIKLPSPVCEEKVKASYQDGVLSLTLPKREEAKPKQIRIDGA